MGDLISREAAIKVVCQQCFPDGKSCDIPCPDYTGIMNLPAVDAVPVVHGQWIEEEEGGALKNHRYYWCSVCCHEIHTVLSTVQEVQKLGGAIYCEHCGARMDGDKNAV